MPCGSRSTRPSRGEQEAGQGCWPDSLPQARQPLIRLPRCPSGKRIVLDIVRWCPCHLSQPPGPTPG